MNPSPQGSSLEQLKKSAPESEEPQYDESQFDFAVAIGRHAWASFRDGRPDWNDADQLAQLRKHPALSALVDILIQFGIERQQGRVYSPAWLCPAFGAFLSSLLGADRVELRTPLRHAKGRRVSPLLQGSPNHRHRQSNGDCDVAIVVVNAELMDRHRADPVRMIQNARRRLREGGLLIVLVADPATSVGFDANANGLSRPQQTEGGWIYRATNSRLGGSEPSEPRNLLPEDRFKTDLEMALTSYLGRGGPERLSKILRRWPHVESALKKSRKRIRETWALRSRESHWKHRRHAAHRVAKVIAVEMFESFCELRDTYLAGTYQPAEPRRNYAWKCDPWKFAEEHGLNPLELLSMQDEGHPAKRALVSYEVEDRIFLGALTVGLNRLTDGLLSPMCIGGRPGSQYSAIPRRLQARLRRLTDQYGEFRWANTDIARCFDSVPLGKLGCVLRRYLERQDVRGLLQIFRVTMDAERRGLPQGNPVSAACLNLFMHELVDRRLKLPMNATVERYLDDISVDGPPGPAVGAVLNQLKDLVTEAGLALHPEKSTGVRNAGPVETLGVLVDTDKITISISTARRVRERTGDALIGSLIHYRRVLPSEELEHHFGSMVDEDIPEDAHNILRIGTIQASNGPGHNGLTPGPCTPPLPVSSKRSRLSPASDTARRGISPSHDEDGKECGFPEDAVLTPWPELDANDPIRRGAVLGVHSSERRAVAHFTQAVLRTLIADDPKAKVAVACAHYDDFGNSLADDDRIDGLILHRVKVGKLLLAEGFANVLPPFVETNLVTFEDYHDLAPSDEQVELMFVDSQRSLQPDRPGVPCTVFPTKSLGQEKPANEFAGASWRSLIGSIRNGGFQVVVVGLTGHGADGKRHPAAVLHDGLSEILEACESCQAKHSFRPTVIWFGASADYCRRSDGSKGPGPGDGLFLQDESDLTIGVERSPRTLPVRVAPLADPDELHYRYVLRVRPRLKQERIVHAGYVAKRSQRKHRKGGIGEGEWDELGRTMVLLGLRDNPPPELGGRDALQKRREVLGDNQNRRAVRTWLAGDEPQSKSPWLPKHRRLVSTKEGTIPGLFGLRGGGAGPTDPGRAARLEKERVQTIGETLGFRVIKGSGSGNEGGDLAGHKHRIEVQCVLDGKVSQAISVEKFAGIASTARRHNNFPCLCLSFIDDDLDLFWIGYLVNRPHRPREFTVPTVVKARTLRVALDEEPPSAFAFFDLPGWEWVLTDVDKVAAMNAPENEVAF